MNDIIFLQNSLQLWTMEYRTCCRWLIPFPDVYKTNCYQNAMWLFVVVVSVISSFDCETNDNNQPKNNMKKIAQSVWCVCAWVLLLRAAHRFRSFTHPLRVRLKWIVQTCRNLSTTVHFYDCCQLIRIHSASPENHLRTFPAVCHLIYYIELISLIFLLLLLLLILTAVLAIAWRYMVLLLYAIRIFSQFYMNC